MATKQCFSLFQKANKDFINTSNDNGQYKNLNLNQNHQNSLNATFKKCFYRKNKSFGLRTAAPTKVSDFAKTGAKTDTNLWKRSTKDFSQNFKNNGFEKEDFGLKKNSNTNNSSTLSLHIEAYENEAPSNFVDVTKKESIKNNVLIQKQKNAKQIFPDSTSVIQNPFEFPRQQERGVREPEVSQYKASQRLINPNQCGGSSSMYRHAIPKSYGGGRIMKKMPGGHSVFYPYEAPSEDVEVKEFSIATSNFEFFHGYNNMFTLQFWTDISIDDLVYKSVDHYYQKMKVFDLTGVASEKFDDPKIKNYSGVAREILRENNISRKSVDDWRTSCGVEVIQKALLEKVKQSTAFRDHLLATADKIICHPFPLDDFFGTGCPVKYVTDWATSMQQKDAKLKFPISFPLTTKTAKNVPSVAKGRNMLGAIYIALREQIKAGNLNDLTVALTPVDQTVKIKKTAPRLPTATMTRLLPPTNQISSANAVPLHSVNAVPLRNVMAPTAAAVPYAGYAAGQTPMMYTAEQQQQFQNNRPSIASQLPEVPVAPDLRYFNNPSGQYAPPQLQQQMRPGPPPSQNQGRAAPPTTDQMYANYQSQQAQYQQQQQQQAQQRRPPTYASLAAQNQDFSMDVDNISGPIANTQVTRQVFQPAGSANQTMYQGSYDWQW